jgi:hypothetical protein
LALFAAAMLQALPVLGAHVCPFDNTFFASVRVVSITSEDTLGYATLQPHGDHISVELTAAEGYEFVHFKSIIVPNVDSLPVTSAGVVNLQMFSHHVMFDGESGASAMCDVQETTCCRVATPAISLYVSGKYQSMPDRWVYGVLDGVNVNGENRVGGTYFLLPDLCAEDSLYYGYDTPAGDEDPYYSYGTK